MAKLNNVSFSRNSSIGSRSCLVLRFPTGSGSVTAQILLVGATDNIASTYVQCGWIQKLEVSSSGGSKLKFTGMANKVDMDVSGAVDIHAFDLQAEIVSLSISGAGDAEINVTKELYAEISGAGTVRYKGDPAKVDSNISGAGSIKKAN